MLVLNRLCTNSTGTYGVFIYDRKVICHTLELPWKGNLKNQSCIPFGQYTVKKLFGHPRLGNSFFVDAVPDRSGILIHAGNTMRDTQGCILPGLDVSEQGVHHSTQALLRMFKFLPLQTQLIIREV